MTFGINRRLAIAGLSAATLGACSSGDDSASLAKTIGLDLSKPEDNVYAIVKIQGDVGGKTTYSWGQGNIFGIKDGEMATPLLRYQSARLGRYFKQVDGSYIFKYRGLIFYQDFETGAFIDEFTNPYTDQTVAVKHYKTSIGQFSYTTKGPKAARAFTGNSGKPYGDPYILPWIKASNRIWVMLDERVEYERPSDKEWRRDNAILRYESNWDELNNPDLTAASATSSFQTHIDWFTWLNMKGETGGIMQGGMGQKFKSLDEFPSEFVEFAERKYPGSLTEKIT